MLNESVLKVSPNGSFKVSQLGESVAICEAVQGDRHNWGNATEDNTVCCSYIKKQSIAHLFNKVQEVMETGDPGMGIFTLGFNREVGENGVYYSVSFDWRERQSEEEKQQLDLIAAFMSAMGNQLIDLEGIRAMTCVDGWTAQQLEGLTENRQQLGGSNQRSLPAA